MESQPVAVPTISRHAEYVWIWQVTALSVVLGILLALSVRTTAQIRTKGLPAARLGVSAAVLSAYREQADRQGEEIKRLRETVQQFQESVNSTSKSQDLLQKQL
ncbi:MAG: hypothetical protein FJX77_01640, partial [Armatimonadetes bacterium]|nr:hypothetical protein [Armatimonadota bacterium]